MFTRRYFMWRWQHMFQPLAADNGRRILEPNSDAMIKYGRTFLGHKRELDGQYG